MDSTPKRHGAVARLALAVMPIAALAAVSCSSVEPVGAPSEQSVIVVGSADTTESAVVADLYAEALARTGVVVRTEPRLGDRATYLAALDAGRITLVPEQTGAYLAYLYPSADVTGADDVWAELNRSLPEGISVSDYSVAEVPPLSSGASSTPTIKAQGEIPARNVLPVFRTGELNDQQIRRLNIVSGELTTVDLSELTAAVEDGEPSADIARSWLDVHGL